METLNSKTKISWTSNNEQLDTYTVLIFSNWIKNYMHVIYVYKRFFWTIVVNNKTKTKNSRSRSHLVSLKLI